MSNNQRGLIARVVKAGFLPVAMLALTPVALAATITLNALPAAVPVGQPLLLKATVNGATTGSVSFYDNNKLIGSKVTLTKVSSTSSTAQFTLPSVTPVGTHSIKAAYGLISNTKSTIAKFATAAAVSTSAATNGSSRAGQAINLAVTLTSASAGNIPTGTVSFYDGDVIVGNATLAGGKASLQTAFVQPGSRTITAVYAGDTKSMPVTVATPMSLTGRDYFVGTGSNASNANQGTELMPWRDLNKLSTVQLKSADDAFRLQCGSEWREQLSIGTANVVDSSVPVTVKGWGVCSDTNRPALNAAIALVSTRWVKATGTSNPIYTYQFAAGELPAAVSQLFVRKSASVTPLQVARYPNAGFAPIAIDSSTVRHTDGVDYATYLTTSTADHAVLTGQDLVGARVHVRVSDFRFADRTIGSYVASANLANAGTLTFSWDPADEEQFAADTNRRERAKWTDAIRKGYGYVLTGKRWMLDAEGEWSYDPATRTLAIWAPAGVSPATLSIEAAVREHGVAATNVKLDLNDVAVRFATQEGIAIDGGLGSRINNVDVAYSGRNGIGIDMNQRGSDLSAATQLLNSRISFSRGSGFISGWAVPNLQVEGNVISETGTFQEPHRADCAICVGAGSTTPVTVRNNLVQGASYLGISFSNNTNGLSNSLIANNVVENVCQRLDDCGGIYTYNANRNSSDQGADITGNTVRGVKGSLAGSPAKRLVAAVGIYLDNDTANVSLSDNVIVDSEIGVVLHDASYIDMQQNTLMGFRRSGLHVGDDHQTAVGIMVRNNNFVAGGTYALPQLTDDVSEVQRLAPVVTLSSEWNRNAGTANPPDYAPQTMSSYWFAGNSYASLYGPVVFELNDPFATGHFKVGAPHWKATWYPADAVKSETAKPLLSPFRATLTGSSVVSNSDMSQTATYNNLGAYPLGWDVTNSTVSLFGPECGAGFSPCAQRVTDPTDGRSSRGSPSSPFRMVDGQNYLLKMRVRTPAGPNHFFPVVGLHCDGWWGASAGYHGWIYTPGAEWVEFQAPFTASGLSRCTSGETRFSLEVPSAKPGQPELIPLYWDDVSIAPATIQVGTSANDYRVLINSTSSSMSVNCPDDAGSSRCTQYVDVNRQPVTFPYAVPANAAVTIIWSGSTFYNASAE
jgi:parallel beta-helix repeat protein